MSSTFGARYHENQELERKKADAERQHRSMLRVESMRGKQAFWQTVQTVLSEDQKANGNGAISMASYKRFVSELFRKFDIDGSGLMEFNEVKIALKSMGLSLHEEALQDLMNDGDTSHDGSLDIEEFTRLVTKSALDSGDELLPRMRAVLESVMSQSGQGSVASAQTHAR